MRYFGDIKTTLYTRKRREHHPGHFMKVQKEKEQTYLIILKKNQNVSLRKTAFLKMAYVKRGKRNTPMINQS